MCSPACQRSIQCRRASATGSNGSGSDGIPERYAARPHPPPLAVACRAVIDEGSRGVRAAVAAYVLWGLLTIYWKQLHGFDPFELIGWRIVSAAIVMAAVVSVRSRWGVLVAALGDRTTTTRLT